MILSRCKDNIFLGFLSVCILIPVSADGGFIYHAAKKSAARRILSKGFNPARFNAKARFGKGIYLSKRPSTAMAEKGKRSSVIRMRGNAWLQEKTIDLRTPNRSRLSRLLGRKYDLRGSVKKGVIGPRTGHRLGKIAGNKKKAIVFRSRKNGGTNIVIPKKTYQQKPNMVLPEKIIR